MAAKSGLIFVKVLGFYRLLYVGMVYLYDVTVNGDFPKIRRHVPGRYQFHFFNNQIPFFLCHIELDLYGSFSATHALIAPFRSEGLGHFPTSNFAGQNTEVGTHFLCLLRKFYPLIPTTKERSVLPKRAKQKRCNPVKVATLLSVIFSCVRTAYLSEFLISATSFAVAVTILNPLSLILSSRVSSCRRCVDFLASLFGKKNWSTDML